MCDLARMLFEAAACEYWPAAFRAKRTPANGAVGTSFFIYFCISTSTSNPELKGPKYQLVIWSIPDPPEIESLTEEIDTIYENKTSPVARCISKSGKPGSKLSWYNGSKKMPEDQVSSYTKPGSDKKLVDSYSDLILTKPTRFDHNRTFSCKVEHETYEKPKHISYTVKVNYNPVNVKIWANTTSNYVYCEADAYPAAVYDWFAPGEIPYKNTASLLMSDLYKLPGYQYFECSATNKVGSAMTRIMVDDLLYPDGKPGFAGLEYWVWACIGGGMLLIILIALIACCCCRNKQKPQKSKQPVTPFNKDAYSVEIVPSREYASQPSIIEMRNSPIVNKYSRTPSNDQYPTKSAMKKEYSLENLVEEKYGLQPSTEDVRARRENVYNGDIRASRENIYNGDSLQRKPTEQEMDEVADQIKLLSQSWDNLARSREHLDRSRQDLTVDLPPPQQMDPYDREESPPSYHPEDPVTREDAPLVVGKHPFGDRGFVSLQRLNDEPVEEERTYPYMDDQSNDGSQSRNEDSYHRGNSYHDNSYRDPQGQHDDRYYDDQRYQEDEQGYYDDQNRSGYRQDRDGYYQQPSNGNHRNNHQEYQDDFSSDESVGGDQRYDPERGFQRAHIV